MTDQDEMFKEIVDGTCAELDGYIENLREAPSPDRAWQLMEDMSNVMRSASALIGALIREQEAKNG